MILPRESYETPSRKRVRRWSTFEYRRGEEIIDIEILNPLHDSKVGMRPMDRVQPEVVYVW